MALKAVVDSVDDLPEDVKAEYVERDGKFHLQVEGMKTQADIDRLQSALTKERNDHKAIKEKFSVLGDRDPTEVVTLLDRIPELEAAAQGKLDDEKINQIVETRVKSKIAPVERERDQLKTQLAEKDGLIEGFTTKEKTRTIHDKVRAAAAKAKVLPEALDDALLLADRQFEVDESGNVVTKDGVGVTPGVDPEVWFTDLQQKRPHWWGPSQGGGAGGSGKGSGGTANPWSHDNWNMTEQGRIYKENPTRAEQLAKAAGTKIGGQRPPKK
jgi:hypothetical protein